MKEEKWTLREIKAALTRCYKNSGHEDDWGVQVVYLDTLKKEIRKELNITLLPKKK